jgi:hypothetical protein
MRTRSYTVTQRVELCLMDHPRVLLVCLDRFFCGKVPNMDQLVVTGDDVCRSWGELTITNPVVVAFEGKL